MPIFLVNISELQNGTFIVFSAKRLGQNPVKTTVLLLYQYLENLLPKLEYPVSGTPGHNLNLTGNRKNP
jgi:hypothetical protein